MVVGVVSVGVMVSVGVVVVSVGEVVGDVVGEVVGGVVAVVVGEGLGCIAKYAPLIIAMITIIAMPIAAVFESAYVFIGFGPPKTNCHESFIGLAVFISIIP